MSEEYAAIFKEEASELLEELEFALLELEESPDDMKIVGRVFRAMHTIKGSGAMFGFDDIADFTHHVETVLDKVREGIIPASKELISLVLASRDHISDMLDAASGEGAVDPGQGDAIVNSLQNLLSGNSAPAAPEPKEEVEADPDSTTEADDRSKASPVEGGPVAEGDSHNFRISFRPSPDFFDSGSDVETLLADLGNMGECTVTGASDGTVEEYRSGKVEAFWDILVSTTQDLNSVKDVFIFAESTSKIKVVELGDDSEADFPEHKKIGDILVERGDVSRDELGRALGGQVPIGEVLVASALVSRDKVNSALKEQKIMSKKREAKVRTSSSIKVAADKLDYLINLVGEMVVTQARLTEAANDIENVTLMEPVEEVERLTSELRDCVLNIRMLPIGTTFSRFKRLVRDLSEELGKEVDMVTQGADTELDKSVIEQLGDPMVHLIRNSIDHGIESPEIRLAAGKPRRGRVRLSAVHSGANVMITVEDDGKGLDAERIKAKSIEKGLIAADAELSEDEIFDLVFGAGVSTAQQVTGISGRGVGMDVVKSTIEGKLKGVVRVNSVLGEGSTITITLPLTLAIIDGLLVKVGNTHFVLPLSQVEECVELTAEDINMFHGRRVFPVREKLVPYVDLRNFFTITGQDLELRQMVIVNVADERVGLVLDDVIGGHQTVIKSLGWVYRNAEGVSGATILGNGEVALVVDVANLVKHATKEEVTV